MFEVKEFLRNIFVMRKSCMYLRKNFQHKETNFYGYSKEGLGLLAGFIFLVYKINAKFSGFAHYIIFTTFSMGQVLLFNM